MTVYTFINPSDDYTFEAPDDAIADAMCAIISPMTGWNRADDTDVETRGGLIGFAPADDQERALAPIRITFTDRADEVAAALRTLEIKRAQRLALGVEDADAWHDMWRTSHYDYRAYALQLARGLDALLKRATNG